MTGFKFGLRSGKVKAIKFTNGPLVFPLLVFFLAPYLVFFKIFTFNVTLNSSEVLWALKNSVIQGGIAAFLCVTAGFFLSLGLLSFPIKIQRIVQKIVLVPFVLPALFAILISFSLISSFPMGHVGVIFIFVLINLGFSVFQISQAIQQKLGTFGVTAEIFGIGRYKFMRKVVIPLVASDIKLNFILVFMFCVSSLAVPLVAGGGKGTNLEVLIYEKAFIDQQWDMACLLLLVQTCFIVLLSYFYLQSKSHEARAFHPHKYVKSKLAGFLLGLYLLIYFGGYLLNLISSFSYWETTIEHVPDLFVNVFESIYILALVIGVSYVVLLVWISDFIQQLKHNIVTHLLTVSTVLVGFSFFIFFPQTKNYDLVKMPLAYTIIFLPSLFKMFFEKKLSQLKQQIFVAKTFGISRMEIIFKIILWQMCRPLKISITLLSIWVLSDYAISKALGTQTQTLGLLAQSFLSSYRLESAYLVSFFILLVWLIITVFVNTLMKERNGTH